MQVGETVAISIMMQDNNRCVFCNQNHDDPKKEKILETAPNDSGWKRKTMSGVFEKNKKKLAIYPSSTFPPSYTYQGHHCAALSAFVKNANANNKNKKTRKDVILRLNHFLKKVGFYPNREKNIIGLPARRSYGAFEQFWDAIDQDAPLQMHGPGHDEEYFHQVKQMITRLISIITNPEFCKELSKDEWEEQLKKAIESLENYAFNKLAAAAAAWRLHANEQRVAMQIYKMPVDEEKVVRGAYRKNKTHNGRGHGDKIINFPQVGLDEGPFRGA